MENRKIEKDRGHISCLGTDMSNEKLSLALSSPLVKNQNGLLSAIPMLEFERWAKNLEWVDLKLGQVLQEAGVSMNFVYFPTTSIISLLYVLGDGASTEIAVIGHEGVLGIPQLMGNNSSPNRAIVQSAGSALRLKGSVIQAEFDHSKVVQNLMLSFTQALMAQMTQTAVCNRHHSLDQQLCRWLLLSLDRFNGNELRMTQELIANMLGVRREGVTTAALKLQKSGLIKYSRGLIHILDRKGLEARSCECYGVVKKEYERLLPQSALN